MMDRYTLMSSQSFGKSTVSSLLYEIFATIDTHPLGSERPLPKPQRRGAIIILGMLALARRSVVTERVDTLLKVGLGPLGKVEMHLLQMDVSFTDECTYRLI